MKMDKQKDENFLECLNTNPKLRCRVEALLNVIENTAGDCKKADDAEQRVVDEVRQMGNDVLHGWAEKATAKAAEKLKAQQPELRKNGKKKSIGIQGSEK